jgi:spore maturation protein CgeB
MKIALFYHTLISDWNHGNAHFLRGTASELIQRGHEVTVYEPRTAWSVGNLLAEHGWEPVAKFHDCYPDLKSVRYDLGQLNLENTLAGVDLVIVHEWNDPELVRSVGQHHLENPHYSLFFHDTHHRMVTDWQSMSRYDLQQYDGVLAYGKVLRDLYESRGLAKRAWTWHEAADTRRFHPLPQERKTGDLVWIGNWGDGEREAELHEFLIQPCKQLGLKATVYGVRYPQSAREALADAGIVYGGWLPNFEAPRIFARHRVTLHVPRGPYVKALPGIPTIRPFEALACGIPLITAPWEDAEHLFSPGEDFLVARDGNEMMQQMERVLNDPPLASDVAEHGLATISSRHTCAHRVNELLSIDADLRKSRSGVNGKTKPASWTGRPARTGVTGARKPTAELPVH